MKCLNCKSERLSFMVVSNVQGHKCNECGEWQPKRDTPHPFHESCEGIGLYIGDSSGAEGSKPLEGIVISSPLHVSTQLEGFSDNCSKDDEGALIILGQHEGKALLLVYADINREEPTHRIDLSGALNTARRS